MQVMNSFIESHIPQAQEFFETIADSNQGVKEKYEVYSVPPQVYENALNYIYNHLVMVKNKTFNALDADVYGEELKGKLTQLLKEDV